MAKCSYYLMGLRPINLVTDPRTLVSFINSYTLDAIDNRRLQHLKKIARYVSTSMRHREKDYQYQMFYIVLLWMTLPISDEI